MASYGKGVENRLRIESDHLDRIRSLAERAYPHECCGILIGPESGERSVEELIEARNQRADSPANRYLISPDFLYEIERKLRGSGRRMIGFFHSHPDTPARPSRYDLEHAWPWYSYLIVSVRKGKAREALSWRLIEDRSGFDPESVEIGRPVGGGRTAGHF